MGEIDASGRTYVVRRAVREDVPALAAMLADDEIGATREGSDLSAYEKAFELVDADPNQFLAVLDDGGEPVGTLQLTFVAGLSRGGALRAQIEAVRVAAALRGQGAGGPFLRWAIDEARRRGATLVQLTTDRRRADAHRFYERLGFVDTHIGYKLTLD